MRKFEKIIDKDKDKKSKKLKFLKEKKVKLSKEEVKKLKQKKKEERKEKKELKKEDKKILNDFKKITDFVDITENNEIQFKDYYMDIFKIRTVNTASLNDNEKEYYIFKFIEFLRSYTDDIKIVGMQFPVDTSIQQEYIKKKLKLADSEIKIKFLTEALEQLEFIEKHRKNKEFFLKIFMKNEEDIIFKKSLLYRSLTDSFIVDELTLEKKLKILFKENNLNTPIA